MPPVYTRDGLVWWKTVPGRQQVNVNVWQIMVNGQKPANLPGHMMPRFT